MTEAHPENRRLGYARVSTHGQTLDAQLDQFRAEGCATIYREKGLTQHSHREAQSSGIFLAYTPARHRHETLSTSRMGCFQLSEAVA